MALCWDAAWRQVRTVCAVLVAVMAVACPATASAETFTVSPAGDAAALKAALLAAKIAAGPDTVRIPAGTYTGPFAASDPSDLEIVGDGPGQTILQNDGSPAALSLSVGHYRVHELGLRKTGGWTTLFAESGVLAVDHVEIQGDKLATGIDTRTAATISAVRISLGDYGVGVTALLPAGAVSVSDSTIEGSGQALTAGLGASLTATRVRLLGVRVGLSVSPSAAANPSTGTISDSLITLAAEDQARALKVEDGYRTDAHVGSLTAHRITAIGSRAFEQTGVLAGADTDGDKVVATVDHSILANMTTTLKCELWLDQVGSAVINARYVSSSNGGPNLNTCSNVYRQVGERIVYGPAVQDANPVTGFPSFANASAGDFRPSYASPTIDAGDPAAVVPAGTTDLAGRARIVGKLDVGAYEYQAQPPTISATAGSASVAVGTAAGFAAIQSDIDDDPLATVEWAFDDGATAQGLQVSHAFSTPGTHSATATAKDASGLTASASVSIAVTPAPLDAGPTGAPQTAQTLLDTTGPSVLISAPACGKRKATACKKYQRSLAAWKTVRGTVSDPGVSSGIGRVELTVYREVGKRFYRFTGKAFKRSTKSQAISGLVRATVSGNTWSLKLPGLATGGRVKISARAYDAAGNPSATSTKTITLSK